MAAMHQPSPSQPAVYPMGSHWYALSFFLCMAVITVTMFLFVKEGWALIHVPNFTLPHFDLTSILGTR